MAVSAEREDRLSRQIAREAGVTDPYLKQALKRQFRKKYSEQIGMVHYHKFKEDRFISSQRKVVEKQALSLRKAHEMLTLRQERATSNRNNSLIDRSRQVEATLNRWEKVVELNKHTYQQRLADSKSIIQDWNDRLSHSASRKSQRLKTVSDAASNSLKRLDEIRAGTEHRNPTNHSKSYFQQREGQSNSSLKKIKHSFNLKLGDKQPSNSSRMRISTEGRSQKIKKLQSNLVQNSLSKIIHKQQRINEARLARHQYLEQRKKQKQQREMRSKQLLQSNLKLLTNKIQQKHLILENKLIQPSQAYKKLQHLHQKRSSLPVIAHSPSPPKNNEEEEYPRFLPVKSRRIMLQKLRQVSVISRRHN